MSLLKRMAKMGIALTIVIVRNLICLACIVVLLDTTIRALIQSFALVGGKAIVWSAPYGNQATYQPDVWRLLAIALVFVVAWLLMEASIRIASKCVDGLLT